MTAADTLTAQRDEAIRCVSRREKLLSTLFGASLAFLSLTEARSEDSHGEDVRERELAAFLDANDISKNRFFDPSTLPSITRPAPTDDSTRRPRSPLLDGQAQQQKELLARGRSPAQTHDHAVPGEAHAAVGSATNLAKGEASGTSSSVLGSLAEAQVPSTQQERQGEEPRREDDGDASGRRKEGTDGEVARHNLVEDRREEGSKEQEPDLPKRQAKQLSPEQLPTGRRSVEDSSSTQAVEPNALGDDQAAENADAPDTTDSARPTSSSDLPSRFMQDAFNDVDNVMMDMPPLGEAPLSKPVLDHDEANGVKDQEALSSTSQALHEIPAHRKPQMRIDTSKSTTGAAAADEKYSLTQSDVATPSRTVPSSAALSPPERMTTRVSSGVLKHKSVSEILGETPRSAQSPSEKGLPESARDSEGHLQTPRTMPSPSSPDSAAFRLRLSELKDKETSKLSTVVFSRSQMSHGGRGSDQALVQRAEDDEKVVKEPRDYFLTMFVAQASSPPRAVHLGQLLKTSNKTLQSDDLGMETNEKQDYKILSFVRDMQQHGRWSLRQPARAPEPPRQATHWDVLLGEMKWMRTDFREERKFKAAGARFLANACLAWVESSAEDRKLLQVKVRHVATASPSKSTPATPELVRDGTSEATEEDVLPENPLSMDPPAAMFSLPPDVFVFGLQQSPLAEKLLSELPCYDPSKQSKEGAVKICEYDPDSNWKTPMVPVSKYAMGKLIPLDEGPPRKRSRSEADSGSTNDHYFDHESSAAQMVVSDEDIALFNPENKHIRDRIHATHAFRPPSEFAMPSKDFYEHRSASQWTLAEDDELRKLVREYAYNWSLISSCLSSPSLFSSGAERRTPWECFERWIILEGLPAEMSKVPYFRTYHARLQQAARAYEARQVALAQQHGQNPAQLPLRRRSNQPFNVEKRKNTRPLHLIDAIRKHAKRKEAMAHKQAQAAHMAELRKKNDQNNNDQNKERRKTATPREWSKLKYERQVKAEEQQRAYRMQMLAQSQARKAQQAGHQVNGVPQIRGSAGMPNGISPGVNPLPPNGRMTAADPARSASQAPRPVNGQPNGMVPQSGQGVPHAPMQAPAQMQMGRGNHPPMSSDMRMLQEAQRVQAQQQAFLQQMQQQPHGAQSTAPGGSPNLQNAAGFPQTNINMFAAMQGRPSPSLNGVQSPQNNTNNNNSSSPRLNPGQPQALSSGVTPAVTQIQTQLKLRHPNASASEISRMTTEQLYRMSQASMAAAVGTSSSMQAQSPQQRQQQHAQMTPPAAAAAMLTNGSALFNQQQQQYAQFMRSQQATQQQRHSSVSSSSGGNGNGNNGTKNASSSSPTSSPVSSHHAKPAGAGLKTPGGSTPVQQQGQGQRPGSRSANPAQGAGAASQSPRPGQQQGGMGDGQA